MDKEDSSLSIDGNLVEDLSKISHTLGLNENTLEVKTEWTVTSSDGEETVYILRESATPTEYTQVQVLSPASGLIASIVGSTITVDYDYRVTAPTAEIQLKSDTNPQLVSEIITLNLEGTFSNPIKSQTLTVATVGGTYSQEYSINITYAPEVFSFSTGHELNYTQEDSHVLSGYLTLHAADTGTGYILVQEAGETAPDFATLKSRAPAYQTYSLKKEEAQWAALVNLEPETEYSIYMGVEYGSERSMESLNAKTIALSRTGGWRMTTWEADLTPPVVRSIKFYLGQTILLPGVVDIVQKGAATFQWIRETPNHRQYTSNYASIPGRAESPLVIGDDTALFYEGQYHLQLIPSQGGILRSSSITLNPQYLEYTLELVD